MATYDLSDIYQCSLEEYAEALGLTVEDLIAMKWREIDLLQEAYEKVLEKRRDMTFALLAKAISEKIHSKRKMIDRYERWLKESKKNSAA
jgi:hypothetical protein